MLDNESMRILRELDAATKWELDGELLAVDDSKEEDGDSGVATVSSDMEPGGLDGPETIENILSCTADMDRHGLIKDIVVLVNTEKDEQLLFTTLERNDLIIARMMVGILNWHNNQIALSSEVEEGGDPSNE